MADFNVEVLLHALELIEVLFDLTSSLSIDVLEALPLMPMMLINVAIGANTTAAWHAEEEVVKFVLSAPADISRHLLALLNLLQSSVSDVLILGNMLLADGAAVIRQAARTYFAHERVAAFRTHQNFTLEFAHADAAVGQMRLGLFLLLF